LFIALFSGRKYTFFYAVMILGKKKLNHDFYGLEDVQDEQDFEIILFILLNLNIIVVQDLTKKGSPFQRAFQS